MPTPEQLAHLERITRAFHEFVPLNRAMGMQLTDTGAGFGRMRMAWDDRFLADTTERWVHGGVWTALLDATCGIAAFMALETPSAIATLDLRVDHLRAAEAGLDLFAEATVVRSTRRVLFVRAVGHTGSLDEPVTTATATFVVTT